MRAAELAQVPDDELLAIYTALRPHRSTAAELEAWAVRLEGWGAARPLRSCARRPPPTSSEACLPSERSDSFASRAERELRRELIIEPFPELGLVAANGPDDPEPELVVADGVVVRMDGCDASDFDVIDRFLVAHGLDLEVAAEAMALPDGSSPASSSTSTSPATSSCGSRAA